MCSAVPSILRQSSAEDAAYRNKLLRLVWSSSKSEKKRSFPDIEAANLYDFYEKLGTLSATHDYESGVLWTNELLFGLPIVQTMYTEANKHLEEGILAALEKSYEIGSSLLPIRSPGFIADYTGIVAYLLLRENPGKKIIL